MVKEILKPNNYNKKTPNHQRENLEEGESKVEAVFQLA